MNPALWKVGTSGNVQRAAGALPSVPARLVRQEDDRARLQTELPLAVNDLVMVDLVFEDGESAFAVTVYAVHRDGLVDVKRWQPDPQQREAAVYVRRSTVGA